MARFVYVIRFRQKNGRDGGYGPVKSFKTTASSPKKAVRKMKKKGGEVVSVRRGKH